MSKDVSNIVIGLVRTPAPVEARLAKENLKNVHLLTADLGDRGSLIAAAVAATPLLPNGLDVLIINGMYTTSHMMLLTASQLADKPEELHKDMHTSLDVNVLGVMYSINAFLPLIKKGTQKKIVAISSGMADIDVVIAGPGIPFQVTYTMMKAALNMIVAKYAAELKSEDIKLLALSPGVVNTFEDEPGEFAKPFVSGSKSELTTTTVPEAISTMWVELAQILPGFVPFMPIESVEAQKKIIDGLTIEDSGKFLSHLGNKQWM